MNARHSYFPRLSLQRVTVRPAKRGLWIIKRFKITPKAAELYNLHMMFKPGSGHRTVAPGTYTGLYKMSLATLHMDNHGDPWMSDTPAEMWDHQFFVQEVIGNVLITGLGLGLVLHNLLLKREVKRVTVVEVDQTLCELVGPHYTRDRRVRIVNADAFKWKPDKGEHFDYAWHDIWPTISGEHCPQIAQLKRRYQHYVAAGKQQAWCEDEMRWRRDEDRIY